MYCIFLLERCLNTIALFIVIQQVKFLVRANRLVTPVSHAGSDVHGSIPGYGLNHASCLQQNLPLTCEELLKAFIPLTMINHSAVAVTFLMRRVRIHSTVCQGCRPPTHTAFSGSLFHMDCSRPVARGLSYKLDLSLQKQACTLSPVDTL